MSLLALGTVAFDTIETPFDKVERIVGGAATYIGISAANFTKPIRLVSAIGGDFPKEKLEEFEKRGIDTEGLEVREDENSFYWAGRYHMDMESRDTLVTEINVVEDYEPKLPDSYKSTPYVMLGNFDPNQQKQVLEQLDGSQKLIAMDTMNLWIENTNEVLKEVISKIDVLIINDEEARQLSNQHSLVKAARTIMDLGPEYMIIKKGENGALLFAENEDVFFAPALPLEDIFDPTGAGDTFAGGFMGYIAQTDDTSFSNMKRAVIYGSAMASFCVEKFGTTKLEEVNQEQIDERVQQFMELVSVNMKAAV